MINNLITNIKYKVIFLTSWFLLFSVIVIIYLLSLNQSGGLQRALLGISILNFVIIVYVLYYLYNLYIKITSMSNKELTLEAIKIISSD